MNLVAFQSISFRYYFLGSVSAVNGLWILRVVLAWLSWEVSGSAAFVGLVAALTFTPTLFSGPFFGVLMDRINIVRAAYGTTLGMLTAALLLLMAVHFESVSKNVLAALALYIGVVASAHTPMRLSIGPRLVERDHIPSVAALAALNFNVARVASPFLAGVLISQFGVRAALILTVLLYVPNLFFLRLLRPRELVKTKDYQSFISAFSEGLSFFWARPYLRCILMATALMAMSVRALSELLPVIADGSFSKGAGGLGQLGAAIGFGSLVCAFVKTMGSSKRKNAFSSLNLGVVAVGIVMTALLATTPSWFWALTAAAGTGFCATFAGVVYQSEIQSELTDNMRGRVMSIWSFVAMGTVAISTFVIGTLVDIIGLQATAVSVMVIALLALVLLIVQVRNISS